MRKLLSTTLLLSSFCCFSCNADNVTISYNGNKAEVSPKKIDDVEIEIKGSNVKIKDNRKDKEPLTYILTGTSADGTFKLNTDSKATVKLSSLNLTSNEGAPLHFKNKKEVQLIAENGTDNTLTITACQDTAKNKSAVIWAKSKLSLSGTGTLHLLATGNGCKGINAKKDLNISELTLDIQTSGDNLGIDTTSHMGPPMGGPGGFGGGPGGMPAFDPNNIPEEVKKQFEEMRKNYEKMMKENPDARPFGPPHGGGGFPGGGNPSEGGGFPGGGFPGGGFPGGGNPPEGGGFMGKQKYVSTCKGIRSQKVITINSGTVTVTTKSNGAEGIEGKEGVIINGGTVHVDAKDDAINSNGKIYFNGGTTFAISRSNDAVDSNSGGFNPFGGGDKEAEPAIHITGGEVYAWSQTGPPEEGLDCDFNPILISGGKTFSIGAGMGEMPSVPTENTAKQPTALLIGLKLTKDQPVEIYEEGASSPLATFLAPFDFNSSASLISYPEFKVGKTYIIKSAGNTYTIPMETNFTTVGKSNNSNPFPF